MTGIHGEPLSPAHLRELRDLCAISDERIAARGYQTITNPRALPIGFKGEQRRPGLLIPIRHVRGDVVSWQLKPDDPRLGKDGKPIRYETPTGSNIYLDVLTATQRLLQDTEAELWITEGAKKSIRPSATASAAPSDCLACGCRETATSRCCRTGTTSISLRGAW